MKAILQLRFPLPGDPKFVSSWQLVLQSWRASFSIIDLSSTEFKVSPLLFISESSKSTPVPLKSAPLSLHLLWDPPCTPSYSWFPVKTERILLLVFFFNFLGFFSSAFHLLLLQRAKFLWPPYRPPQIISSCLWSLQSLQQPGWPTILETL